MRFPLRRHHTPEAVMERISRIEGQFQPEVVRASDPFDPPDAPYAWGAPRSEDSPPVPSFAPPEPLIAVEPPPAPPLLHAVDGRMRSQFTSSDSRADRLIRQVRGEVEQLKQTLESLAYEGDEMLGLNIQALVADPEHATTLPPAVLVRALVESAAETERLKSVASDHQGKAAKLQRKLRDLRREDAARQARLDTLEEVIAALHENLQDLRIDRDRVRVTGPQTAALRAGSPQLPSAGTGMSSCE